MPQIKDLLSAAFYVANLKKELRKIDELDVVYEDCPFCFTYKGTEGAMQANERAM